MQRTRGGPAPGTTVAEGTGRKTGNHEPLEETPEDRLIGATVRNRYKIKEMIGKGGMGGVYKAEDLKDGTIVAFKVIDEQLAQRPEMLARFAREAQVLARINHPNVVDVLDMKHFGNKAFLTMEYLEGNNLSQEIHPNGKDSPAVPLSWKKAGPILIQICDALAAAHDLNILHRDIKPGNLFLIKVDGKDVAKVLDFGLAKIKEDNDAGSDDGQSLDARLTKTGFFLGTPTYGSPEQALGEKDYDGRSDIYSLGVVMFELLTGTVPFKNPNYQKLLQMHIKEPPPMPRDINPDIPPGVEEVILRTLAKKPEERFQTSRELKDALFRCLGERSQGSSSDEFMQGAFSDSSSGGGRMPVPETGDSSSGRRMLSEEESGSRQRSAPGAFGRLMKRAIAIGVIGGAVFTGYQYRHQISREVKEITSGMSAPSASPTHDPAPQQPSSASRSETGRRVDITITPDGLSVFVAGSRERPGRFLGYTPLRNLHLETGEDELVIWRDRTRMVVRLGRDQTIVGGPFRPSAGGAVRTRPANQAPGASDQAPATEETPLDNDQQ